MKYVFGYFRVEFYVLLSYRMNFLLEYCNQFIAIIIKIQLWEAISKSNKLVLNKNYYITYFIFAFIISQFTTMELTLAEKVRNGDLTVHLIQPINIGIVEYCRIFANKIISVLKFIPLFFILTIIYYQNLYNIKISFKTLWFVTFIILGFTISFLIQFFIDSIAFWFIDISAVKYIYSTSVVVLSGALFPFEYLPDSIRKVFSFLPFQYLINAPLSVLMTDLKVKDIFLLLLLGILYIVVFLIINVIVFNLGLKKYTAVGG